MAREGRFEWDKQGALDAHASFHAELPAGVTLSSPSAELHERTSTSPETWVDRSSEVTITPTVVDALADGWVAETGGTDRGVRVVIEADADPQPDVTDEPQPGTAYRVKIIATRSDTSKTIARSVPLTILP